eukprot:8668768-Alexandrium_andersonii.AAC.1
MSSRNSLSDWAREGHDGQIFASPETVARREQELEELRRQSVAIRQGMLENADQTRRVEHFRTAIAEAMGMPSTDVDPRDMLVRVSDAISRVEKGVLSAKDGLTMAVRLTQWARGRFKIANCCRDKM